jgi:hypothetical protein
VERDRTIELHARLIHAVERGEHVQRQSRALVANHAALHEALCATLERLRRSRAARGEPLPPR